MYFPRLFVYLVARLFRETEPLWSWRVAPCSLFVHFTRNFSLRILFKKKKKNCNSVSFTRAWIYKLDLGRCRTSPLCRRKNSRDTPSIFYLKKRETANRRDISIFFFFCELFFILYFYLFTFSFSLSLSGMLILDRDFAHAHRSIMDFDSKYFREWRTWHQSRLISLALS